MPPLLSVIIPTDQEMHFVEAWLIRSCEKDLDAEVCFLIITADASSAEWLRGLGLDSVQVIEVPKGTSPGLARNRGLDAVTTPLVAFIDADDDINPEMLVAAALHLARTSMDMLAAPYFIAEGATRRMEDRDAAKATIVARAWSAASVWRFVFRTQFLSEQGIRFPDGRTAEDVGFMLQVVKAQPSVTWSPQGWYTYRLHSTSQSSRRIPTSWSDVTRPIRMIWSTAWAHRSPQTVALAAEWTSRIAGVSAKRVVASWLRRR